MTITPCRGLRVRGLAIALLIPAAVQLLSAQAQSSVVISGRVTSDQGQPLTAATVHITELGVSVATNAAGRYSITLTSDSMRGQLAIVRARSIGFRPDQRQLQLTAGLHTLDFVLVTDVNRLEELVITGVTGATELRLLPFTVAKVSAADMPVPFADPLSQLRGKVPGAQITSYTGRPGSQPDVLLRGPKSLNALGRGQNPLFIVDGIIINGSLIDFNTLDIASIEVVEGAAAATLYGSRAGSGVIQITTKRGRLGLQGTQFTIRSEYGQGDLPHNFPLATRNFLLMDETGKRFCIRDAGNLDCARAVDINEEALRINEGSTGVQPLPTQAFVQDYGISVTPSRSLARALFQVNPWPRQYNAMESATTSGAYASLNLDMSGSSGTISYFASVSGFMQEAPFVSLDGFRRRSVRLNLDNQLSQRWQFGLSMYYSASTSGAANQDEGRGFQTLLRVPAGIDLRTRDKFGRRLVRSNPLSYGGTWANPLYEFDADRQTNEGDRFLGSVFARFAAGWLVVDGNIGHDKLGTGFLLLRDQGYRVPFPPGTQIPSNGRIRRYIEGQDAYNSGLNFTASPSIWGVLASRFTTRFVLESQRITANDQYGTNLVVSGLTNSQAAKDSIAISSTDQTISAVGLLAGVNLVLKNRYIADMLFRRDGSSLLGVNDRWANYGRGSLAWRLTQESWWPIPAVSELKVRASVGTAGGRPRFDAQFETYAIASGGGLSANTLGNGDLKPEVSREAEYGVDAELFRRIGVNVTYAHAVTRDQLQLAPASVSSGFTSQWLNAGTLDNKSWEASLDAPIVRRRTFAWSARVNYARNRPVITDLGLPPYAVCPGLFSRTCQGAQSMLFMQGGAPMGAIYGSKFLTTCKELSAEFASQCGPGREWQKNNEGLIVWIGKGHTPAEGITQNLWQAERFGCVHPATGAKIDAIGAVACRTLYGAVNTPNGVTNVWGNPILLRDSLGGAVYAPLGNTLPSYRVSLSQTVTFHRVSAYALVDASIGNDVYNEGRHFSLGEFQTREQDQDGKTVETAKPMGHYWRGGLPEGAGSYGYYNVLSPNSVTVEDASYAKLRELSLAYRIGPVSRFGDWSVSVLGRNLHTLTRYSGFDPEVGKAGGQMASGAINGIDAWQYPNVRTVAVSFTSRF